MKCRFLKFYSISLILQSLHEKSSHILEVGFISAKKVIELIGLAKI